MPRGRRRWSRLLDTYLPGGWHRRVGAAVMGESYRPPVGKVNFGSLRRTTPISRRFGYDRGLPVDRHYIEHYFERRSMDIRGRVLEIGHDEYTRRFGGDRVAHSDVLHLFAGSTGASYVADLSAGDGLPSHTFDCLVVPQTLHLVYDTRAALRTAYRILRPGGVLLATFPGISQRSDDEWAAYWCWSFTTLSASRLFHEVFEPADVTVESYGNVLSAVSFLEGLAASELSGDELGVHDPSYAVVIAVRAVKGIDRPAIGPKPRP